MHARRVILLEFNELCPQLMDRFIAAGKLPHFARLRAESEVHTTESDEGAPYLEPWIQWITVHSGVPYQEHRVFHLGDGWRFTEKNLWDVLSDEGKKVWVCGSMNLNYRRPLNGFVLPDPWTDKVAPYPDGAFAPYYRFVSANVQEYTREKVPLTLREQAEFVAFMATHGLQPETALAIAQQLASERLGGKTYWKRAVILDRLQFDLFRHVYRREKPDFSTFFINSTAHFQHLYWRNMEPHHFALQPEPGEQAVYQHAILFGYQQMDRLLGEFVRLAGDDTTIVFSTALSQQPYVRFEDKGGKTIYRPRDFDAFARALGLPAPTRTAPVMAHQFHMDFASDADADLAERKLRALTFRGAPALDIRKNGRALFGGSIVWETVPDEATLDQEGRSLRFFDLFYHIDLVKSGFHHPDGMLWIRTPERRHLVNPDKVPLVAVAPSILELFGVAPPASMKGAPIRRAVHRAA